MLPALVPFPQQPPAPADTSNPHQQQHSAASSAPPQEGRNPSLLVAAAVILFVFLVTAAILLLLRFLTRQRLSPSSSSTTSASLILLRRRGLPSSSSSSFSSSSPAAAAVAPPSPPGRRDQDFIIDSLPLFTLASSLAALPRSSPDCAVCLSRFDPDDQLCLLPSCRHAFHSACIDTWLRSSLSCPLCRSPISREQDPLPPPPPTAAASPQPAAAAPSDRPGSYRVEIGSVSRRRTADSDVQAPPPNSLAYSLGSSFEYVVEQEVEAVVSALAADIRRQRQDKDHPDSAPAPPGDDVAESAAGGGGSRSWLRNYLDRLASSASSSSSSLRFSGRGSRRIDGGIAGGAGEGGSWDLEGNRRWPREEEEEIAGAYNTFYRWLVGP